MKKKITTYLSKREFTKNILTLMTGNTIALAIPIAITPILTRIYSPEDFGILAIFMAITAIVGSISGATYEQAIVLQKKDNEAINVLALSIGIVVTISFIVFIIILLFNYQIVSILGNDRIKKLLYFLPVSILFSGLFNTFNLYNVRKKNFKTISISQVSKFISLGIIQIGIGLLICGAEGLVLGQTIAPFVASVILFKKIVKNDNYKNAIIKLNDLKKLAIKYKKFPFFLLPSIFLEIANVNLINILVSSFFSITTLGFFSITERVLTIPSRIIGQSIKQVYYQKASEEYNDFGSTYKIFITTLKNIVIVIIPIFIFIFFVIEPLFAFVFGEEWRIAGSYAKILIPFFLIRFIYTPLSSTLNIHQKQQYGLFMNLIVLLSTFLIFYFGHIKNIEFIIVLKIFSLILSIEYSVFILLNYFISKNNNIS